MAEANAELARQTAEKLDEMERLLSVSRALSSTIELGPLLRTLLQQVTRTTGADTAGVWLADPATGELEPFAGYHVTPHIVEQLRGFRIDPDRSPLYADAIARRAAVTVEGRAARRRGSRRSWWPSRRTGPSSSRRSSRTSGWSARSSSSGGSGS